MLADVGPEYAGSSEGLVAVHTLVRTFTAMYLSIKTKLKSTVVWLQHSCRQSKSFTPHTIVLLLLLHWVLQRKDTALIIYREDTSESVDSMKNKCRACTKHVSTNMNCWRVRMNMKCRAPLVAFLRLVNVAHVLFSAETVIANKDYNGPILTQGKMIRSHSTRQSDVTELAEVRLGYAG